MFLYRIQNYIRLSKEYRSIINPSQGDKDGSSEELHCSQSPELGLRRAFSLWLSIPLHPDR